MEATTELDSRAGILAAVRRSRAAEVAATADQLRHAAAWAAMHPVDSLDDAAASVVFGETVIPVAGPGAPMVGEFCVAELAAALGLPTEHGRWLIGEALELEHRLPRLWSRVMRHDLPAWRARRIARRTMELSPEAATFVDRQIAHLAHKVGSAVVDRLVDEAIARFMPETAEERRAQAAESRFFAVDHRNVSFAGTSRVYGELDLADALDLDAAVTARAATLKELGCDDALDARRAVAVGEIARADLTLDLTSPAPGTPPNTNRPHGGRETVLHVHLSGAALTSRTSGDGVVGRVGNAGATDTLVTAEQIRQWCANPSARVVVKPVIDLDGHVHATSYRSLSGSPSRSVFETAAASSRGAPARPTGATVTTSTRTPGAAAPMTATSPRCADDTTGSRPTPSAGSPRSSTPGRTSGAALTATGSSATTPAPATSATNHHPDRADTP